MYYNIFLKIPYIYNPIKIKEYMTSQEIRNQFLEFFKSKGHKIVPGSPVVPFDDPTLLFTNAGMNQFKDVFLGKGSREYKRAADTQKCIRVSGKHNDLEEVGRDTYHHTFFEMLGNWSFGDYYKEEAIMWAWELLTEVWKLPKERLWATVYRTDDEAMEIWKTKTDINPKHILKFAEKDNFWEMGETGPCGPCSEIHINLSDDYENPKYVNAGMVECIEIWNLVFIQYNREADKSLTELPAKHVDTGMGFERVCAVLQGKSSNYDTDVFTPLINRIAEVSGTPYKGEETQVAMRVIADHVRTLSFAIADGAAPSNEGRGYVLRRILRRAARYGRKIGLTKPFIYQIVPTLSQQMSATFPELKEKLDHIQKIIKAEEESFNATLDRGIEHFEKFADSARKNKTGITGENAFMLYDTYGFPVDLTAVMAREAGLSIDEAGFEKLMAESKSRSREAGKDKFAAQSAELSDPASFGLKENEKTEFIGYDTLVNDAKIIGYKKENGHDLVILDKTPFYAESGGQTDDLGVLTVAGEALPVVDLVKIPERVVHVVENKNNVKIEKGMQAKAEVDGERRLSIMRNHSATHLMHAALRQTLGTHVQQAGSYVGPDRLRFDFAHFSKLTDEEIKKIEMIVNAQIRKAVPLNHHRAIAFDKAKEMGALMFFGDKYGDKVNVVQFGDFSKEFCGGAHVSNTAVIGMFKIVAESSISSGVRRIEAVTGAGVEEYLYAQEEKIKQLEEKIQSVSEEKKKLEKELGEFKLKDKLGDLTRILSAPTMADGVNIYKGKVDASSMDELKAFGDEVRMKTKEAVGVLVAELDGKAAIVCAVTDDIIKTKKLSAGKIVGDLAKIVEGGGGGKPHLATAGGKDVTKINDLLAKVEETVKKYL
jgi:alanyl-tRNA synthetase